MEIGVIGTSSTTKVYSASSPTSSAAHTQTSSSVTQSLTSPESSSSDSSPSSTKASVKSSSRKTQSKQQTSAHKPLKCPPHLYLSFPAYFYHWSSSSSSPSFRSSPHSSNNLDQYPDNLICAPTTPYVGSIDLSTLNNNNNNNNTTSSSSTHQYPGNQQFYHHHSFDALSSSSSSSPVIITHAQHLMGPLESFGKREEDKGYRIPPTGRLQIVRSGGSWWGWCGVLKVGK